MTEPRIAIRLDLKFSFISFIILLVNFLFRSTVKKKLTNALFIYTLQREGAAKRTEWRSNLKRGSVDESSSRSESVKNLIEQVKNTLKAIEDESNGERRERSSWQYHMYEFDSTGGEFSRHCPERASTGKIKTKPETHAKLKSGTKSVTTLENLKDYERRHRKVLLVGSDKTINEAHKRAFKAAGGKILHKEGLAQRSGSNLRIRIAKSPIATDSSNEYETETGIPKSPTLFISGVSISRTPEPCSPASVKEKRSPEHKTRKQNLSNLHGKINSYPLLNFVAASIDFEEKMPYPPEQFEDHRFLSSGRQSRSSSLTVPKSSNPDEQPRKKLNTSCGAIPAPCGSLTPPRKKVVKEEPVFNFCGHESLSQCFFKTIEQANREPEDSKKSKSASEPERERERFRFPKSSTDGALSSVLHVQESNLSSDDFHEVLFLLERSPKHNSKRRKRSKKERDKVKEDFKEISSVL